jgi:hypothetical protein
MNDMSDHGSFCQWVALALIVFICRLPLKAFGRGAGATFVVFAAWPTYIYGMGHIYHSTYIILGFSFDRCSIPSPIFTFSWFWLLIES